MFPHPRLAFWISVALAIPTYGASLAIFYFVLKRPYDSKAISLILAEARRSLETGQEGELFHVNSAATGRLFLKFADAQAAKKYGVGVPFVQWGLITHPMINGGAPFSLRVSDERSGARVRIEAAAGEDWTLLKEEY